MAPKRASSAQAKARPKREVEKISLPATKLLSKALRSENVCGACLLPVDGDSQIGLIDSCKHFFHYECVERWAHTENSCPQCKLRFFWLGSYTPQGKRTSLERIKRRDQEGEEDEAFEDYTVCERCKQVGEEDTLLLCDGMHGTCNAAYHCACVGLSAVPRGSWFCSDCIERGFDVDAQGRRGKRATESARSPTPDRKIRRAAIEEQPDVVPETLASASSSNAVPRDPASVHSSRGERIAPAALSTRRAGATLPPQLRLNSLACVTPHVDGPSFQIGAAANRGESVPAAAGGQETVKEGLFANFAARRRQRRGQSDAQVGSNSPAFSLNPAYEEDYLGRTLK